MRPERLELSGFTAYRQPTVVDFSSAELFALVGPTGSGKTALIDAICFSLYGSIPRLDDRRKVEPVISLGKQEARVRFDFTVGDRGYTAVRVVRRTKVGATTAEARLMSGEEVIAGNADEVSLQVEKLLGLDFDHFTKCVVLPQGEFAAFLHDKPANRQALLRRLLDLGIYDLLRELAGKRRDTYDSQVMGLKTQLEEVAGATPEALRSARSGLEQLSRLRSLIATEEPKLDELRRGAIEFAAAAVEDRRRIASLKGLRMPGGLIELTARIADGEDALLVAGQDLEQAMAVAEEAQAARQRLPAELDLSRWLAHHDQLVAEMGKRATAAQALSTAQALEAEARKSAHQARQEALNLRNQHAAHGLAIQLVAGEPCPVCRQPVSHKPSPLPKPAGIEKVAKAAAAAEKRLEEAVAEAAGLTHRRQDLENRIKELETALTAAPAGDEVRRLVELAGQAQAAWEKAGKAVGEARRALDLARAQKEAVGKEAAEAWRVFDRVRDQAAPLGPPTAARQNIVEDWNSLEGWGVAESSKLAAAAERAEAEALRHRQDLETLTLHLQQQLEDHGIDPSGGRWTERVVEELTNAAGRLSVLEAMAEKAKLTREAIERQQHLSEVAKVLAQHLRADGFVAWLLEEALDGLVEAANHLLADLSGGGYTLERQKQDFWVVDHRNADQRRPVKTLSGGETFLVSLSLALAMAEGLATLSGRGGSRLESIFLDEGFGSLDAETLEVVADVIQELGARGRVVGVVTHVAELAERVPVRFEVKPGAHGATVERVEL